MEFLVANKSIIVLLHALSAVLGVGGALVTDILFLKFLSDKKISKKEKSVGDTLSKIMWSAMVLLVITGIMLWLPRMEVLNETPKFLVKVIAIGVIIVNGIILNAVISPKLTKINFGKKGGKNNLIRKMAFANGPISILSWLIVFILGSISVWPYTFLEMLVAYIIILAIGVCLGQVTASLVTRKKI